MSIEFGSDYACGGCGTCGNCQTRIFPDGVPASVQSELSGNAYSTVLAPSNTSHCCSGWTAKVLGLEDIWPDTQTLPNCFSAGFTYDEFLDQYNALCTLDYYWEDTTCKDPGHPLNLPMYRGMAAWFAKHPSTGNIWVWALARVFESNFGIKEYERIVEGYLDTGLTSLPSGSGPFTVPIQSSCDVINNGTYTRVGCWSTTRGNLIVTV